MRTATVAGLVVWLAAAPAAARSRGEGTTHTSPVAPAPSKDAAPMLESPIGPDRDLAPSPRHGMLGAPGAAQDALGASRLGPHGGQLDRPSWGEAAPGTGESYSRWHSGDRVRSPSSADVRQARQQQAPDLEWATGAGDSRTEPQRPSGVKAPHRRAR